MRARPKSTVSTVLQTEVSELQKFTETKDDLELLRSELSVIGPVVLN